MATTNLTLKNTTCGNTFSGFFFSNVQRRVSRFLFLTFFVQFNSFGHAAFSCRFLVILIPFSLQSASESVFVPGNNPSWTRGTPNQVIFCKKKKMASKKVTILGERPKKIKFRKNVRKVCESVFESSG